MNEILKIEGLTKQFGGFVAVNDVTLSIPEGAFKAVIGPNGAGKTTLFNLISGSLSPTRGRIFFRGEDITHIPTHLRSKKGISRSYQKTSIFPSLTVFENVRMGVQSRAEKKINFNLFSNAERYAQLNEKTWKLLETVNLKDKAGDIASNVSHPDQRKLEIAIALSTDPSLLLLDEPTAGMAVEEIPEMLELIDRLWKIKNLTILIVEHKLDMIMEIVDSVIVMAEGSVIANDKPQEIRNNEYVQRVYLGEDR